MVRSKLLVCLMLVLGVGLFHAQEIGAQDIARLQSGVVKITAKPPQGTANVGTGFIVRVDKEAVYIVTAAHVVAGDTHPKVEFFTKRNLPVTAEVLGLEGDDEVRGLALLVMRGPENLPKGLTTLSLAGAARLTGGEEIVVIGFPRNAGPWAIVKGNISSRQGRDIYFSPSVESGHSGGPIFQGGKVVGVVGSGSQSVGRGITVGSVEDYMEGFGISAQERTSIVRPSLPKEITDKVEVDSPPEPQSSDRTQQLAMKQNVPIPQVQPAEKLPSAITGKDGAPMVLIPAGEFWMGSLDGDGDKDEYPRHQIYLDAFYMDKFKVTVARYAEFMRATNWSKPPHYWGRVDSSKHRNLPVVGVDWHDAKAYCEWAGKQLPTEAEWEKAARGTDGRTYPWGNEQPTAGLANFGKGGTNNVNVYDDRLAPVDSYEAGKSPYGLHHMAGNVREWVADWYDDAYYSKSPERNPKGPSGGDYRVVRGGSWFFAPAYLRAANRHWFSPSHRHRGGDIFGFRCAQDRPN